MAETVPARSGAEEPPAPPLSASPVLVIVNPTAASGRSAAAWRQVEPILRARFPTLQVHLTTAPGDAEQFARERGHDPSGIIMVVGGDGSVHEVINGMLSGNRSAGGSQDYRTRWGRLAIVPTGTGNDVARNLGIPLDPQAAAQLDAGSIRRVDVARCSFRDPTGGPRTRYFVNSLSTGVSARANRLAVRIGGLLAGPVRYPIAGALAIVLEAAAGYEVIAGDQLLHRGKALNLTLANGACFGGGLRISPGSRPDDGALDLVVIGAIGRLRALRALAGLRRGTHTRVRGVRLIPGIGPLVRIAREKDPVLIEVDGENLEATGELTVELLPGYLAVVS